VRVYSVGFGTTEPAPMACTPDQISGDAAFRGDGQGPPGGFRGGRYQLMDETTLTKVAEMTGGKFFHAEDAEELNDIMTDLPTSISLQQQDMEITVWFALAGAVLILVAVGLSQWWNRSAPLSGLAASPPGPGRGGLMPAADT
jgi:Ca-activated chloride channel family protein